MGKPATVRRRSATGGKNKSRPQSVDVQRIMFGSSERNVLVTAAHPALQEAVNEARKRRCFCVEDVPEWRLLASKREEPTPLWAKVDGKYVCWFRKWEQPSDTPLRPVLMVMVTSDPKYIICGDQ